MPVPTQGRIVLYTLSKEDVASIKDSRANEHATLGRQINRGNDVSAGDTYPMLIVQVWGKDETSGVNGQVFLDGNHTFWATSVSVGTGPRTFAWPVVPAAVAPDAKPAA